MNTKVIQALSEDEMKKLDWIVVIDHRLGGNNPPQHARLPDPRDQRGVPVSDPGNRPLGG